jgi:hypothetical protein
MAIRPGRPMRWRVIFQDSPAVEAMSAADALVKASAEAREALDRPERWRVTGLTEIPE